MKVTFEGKANNSFDDIDYSWLIESEIQTYRIVISFIGAIDENQEENLYNAMCAELTIYEIDHHDIELITDIYNLLKDRVEIEINADTMCNTIPEVRTYLRVINESSFDDTISDYNKLLYATIGVLMSREMKTENILDTKELISC